MSRAVCAVKSLPVPPSALPFQRLYAAVLASLLLFFSGPSPSSAAVSAEARAAGVSTTNVVSPEQLSQSIDEVLQKREFAWRMPREEPNENTVPQSWLGRLVQSIDEMIHDTVRGAARALEETLRWIGETLSKLWPAPVSSQAGMAGWGSGMLYSLQILLLLLICALAGVLVVLILRAIRRRRRDEVVLAEPVAVRPDLSDENVVADQLPEDGWLEMAREMMEQGNLLLALRAFYLASLAHLAAREMISIAIFKSNREYEAELRRRARALPDVQSAFSQNVATFDRAWYGLHEVTRDGLQEFQSNLARIRAC
jgi:hypothetical protein